ncbi:MAG: histidinol-phosphate transaminase [Eubacteriales bacterium]
MNKYIPQKLRSMEAYEPITGQYPVRLDANESFITLPADIMEEINSNIGKLSLGRYPDASAVELRETYSSFSGVPVDNIVAGNGSDELINIIISSFLSKGDKMLSFTPDFSMYSFYGGIIEADVRTLPKKSGFVIDLNEALDYINQNEIKLVIFSNPCNPTGQGIEREAVLSFVRECGCIVVLDEAYMDFWGGMENSLTDVCTELDNLIILKTMSKAVGLAGLRVGFVMGDRELIASIAKAKSPYNLNSLSQELARIVLSHPDYIRECIRRIRESKAELQSCLSVLLEGKDIELIPTVTNFVLLKTSRAKDIFYALKDRGVIVRVQMGQYLRITAGNAEETKILLEKLSEVL